MENTLIVYEDGILQTKKMAEKLGYIIGNTKVIAENKLKQEAEKFQNIVLVLGCNIQETLKEIKNGLESNKGARVAVVGGGMAVNSLKECVHILTDGRKIHEEMIYLSAESLETQDAGLIGSQLAYKLKPVEKPMGEKELSSEIAEFIKRHNMMALATGQGNWVRCSPVEYIYDQEKFYIITEGGMKFRGLLKNNQVSIGIYDSYKGMQELGGLQITGKAEIVPLNSKRYYEIMKIKGVAKENLEKLPVNLYIVEIEPLKFEFLYSPLAKKGYSAKQIKETKEIGDKLKNKQ